MAVFKDVLELVDKVSKPLENIANKTDKVTNKTEKLKNTLNKVGGAMKKVAGAATIAIGAVGAIGGAVMKASQKYADFGDRIDKMSQKIGMSTRAFQEWDYIMSQNGGNVESLQMGFKTLVTQIEGVQKGSKDSIKAFSALGVSVKENNGQFRKADDVFNDVIRKLQKIKDPTQKMILANRLFGRSAAELRPLLNQEAEAIDNLREKANKFGLVISDEDIKNAVKYKDTMDTLSRVFNAKFATVMMQAMPEFTTALEEITQILNDNQETIEYMGQALKWTFTTTLPAIVKGVSAIANYYKWLGEIIGNVLGSILSFPTTMSALFAIMKAKVVASFVSIKNSIISAFDAVIAKIIEIISKIPILGSALKNLGLSALNLAGGSYRQSSTQTTNNNNVTNNNYFGNTYNNPVTPLTSAIYAT